MQISIFLLYVFQRGNAVYSYEDKECWLFDRDTILRVQKLHFVQEMKRSITLLDYGKIPKKEGTVHCAHRWSISKEGMLCKSCLQIGHPQEGRPCVVLKDGSVLAQFSSPL